MGLLESGLGIAGGIADFIGQQNTNQKSWDIAQASNAASAEQAQKQMDFQERMSSTAYQRAVKDMSASGLNPMLAYTQGGATTPSGAAGTVSVPTFKSPLSSFVSSGQSAALNMADLGLKDASTTESISRVGVNDEMRKKLDADTKLTILQSSKVPYEIKQLVSQSLLNDARQTATNAEEAATRHLMPKYSAEGDYYRKFGFGPYALRDIGNAAGSAASVFNTIRGRQPTSTTSTTIHPSGESTIHRSDTKYGN